MTDRSPELVLSGQLEVLVGGTVRAVPTLKLKYIPEWTRLLDGYTPSASARPAAEGFTIAAETETTALLDLVVAYDRTGALGGREWLEENADPADLRAAVQQILGNVYPKGMADLAWMVLNQTITASVGASVGASVLPSSTNGSSTTGTSRPNRSVRRSTRSK